MTGLRFTLALAPALSAASGPIPVANLVCRLKRPSILSGFSGKRRGPIFDTGSKRPKDPTASHQSTSNILAPSKTTYKDPEEAHPGKTLQPFFTNIFARNF
jgi:hypothetical protein